MNVRKFNSKSKIYNPKTIQWRTLNNLKYPPININPITWEIFSQKEITLTPGQVTHVGLGLGFTSTKGVILITLEQHLKWKKCSLQNEISYGDKANILVAITNNSEQDVTIKENELLCFVYYQYQKNKLSHFFKKKIDHLKKWK